MYNDFFKNKFLNSTKTSYIMGDKFLYSYGTCVGIIKGCKLVTTEKYYSNTTSKQIAMACRKLYLQKEKISPADFIAMLQKEKMEAWHDKI